MKWKFDLRRDFGIYLGDADDTKRDYLILNPSTYAVHPGWNQMQKGWEDKIRKTQRKNGSSKQLEDTTQHECWEGIDTDRKLNVG